MQRSNRGPSTSVTQLFVALRSCEALLLHHNSLMFQLGSVLTTRSHGGHDYRAVAFASAGSHHSSDLTLALAHPYASLVGRGLVEDGEAQRLEFRRGLRAPQIRMKGCGVGIARFCCESHGIDDRRVRVIGENANDPNVLIAGGIGLIDDAERRLAARDTQQGSAHVRGLRELVSNARPDVELLECRLSVLAGRDAINIGQGEITTTDQLGQVKSLSDLDGLRLVLASNQHDAVTE